MKSLQGKAGGYVLTRAAAEIRQRGPLRTPAEQCTEPCPIARGPEALPGIGVWLTSVSGSDG